MTQQSLTSDKKELLARLLQQKKHAYCYPLSYGQQALWFIYQNAPDSPAYNMAWPVQLQGSLKLTALQTALQTLVNRHPALRTTIDIVNGEPVQTVQPTGTYQWNEHQSVEWSEQQLNSALKTAYEQPFDLTLGPVLRADLFSVDTQEYVFLLTMHHILGDADSMNILGNELLTLYQAELKGNIAVLPSITAAYSDFVKVETAMLNSSAKEEMAQYWQHRLGGESSILNLPIDYPRPAVQSFNGSSVLFCLPTQLSRQLRQLARQEESTLFALLLTAFQILLHRYTGQIEIRVGTPTSTGRQQPRFSNVIGYLVNPLVLGAAIDPYSSISFNELLSQTGQTVSEALEYSDYPFPLQVRTLQPRRDPSYAPLFQVMLDFKAADFSVPNITNLGVSPLDMPQMEGQFDLTLSINDNEQLGGRFNYNRDLFRSETIERMAEHFEVLLTAIADNPEKSVSHLPILLQKEVRQLQEWNDTARDYPKDQTIVDLFEQQVKNTPDNIAVIFEDQQLTYCQLNEKANQLAHYLLSLKSREGTLLLSNNPLIAIAVERSLEMLIGLFGILKAGGAYVPIDPGYPKDRISYMLEDSAAPVLLTQSRLKTDILSNESEHECIVVCPDEADFSDQPTENPVVNNRVEDLAYVIYTSGSTGKPKGAMNAHTGVVNRLLWMQEIYQITSQDRILQKTPFSFDVSVWEFFWPLITGAGLVIAKPEGHKNPEYMASVIAAHDVTVLHFVPSMLQIFVNHADVDKCQSLTRIICSGEALSPELVKQFFARFAGLKAELHNLYGPTEAAVDVSHWPCRIEENLTSVPIGKPIANTQLYVLDANRQIVPIGIPGELYIGGIQVGRGYLNRPNLTAETFIEVGLFGKNERVYKTGDLARWLPDGNIEYLGRIDHQVKLRGFRIELGEIETAILQVQGIRESVVILSETESGHKQLTAYVVPKKQDIQEEDIILKIKEYLKQKLPDYMVPSVFMFIENIPLSPNGKADRKALPEPAVRKRSIVYPRDAAEFRLARLWEKLFDISPVNVLDDFFESGGDSLLAIRLVSHIEQEFNISLPLHTLFQNRTVEQLACILRQDSVRKIWDPLVCLQPQGSKTPIFCVHASGGSAFNYLGIASLMGTDRPFYAIQPRGSEPGEPFHPSIEEMAADYVYAIRKAQAKGPYLLAGWSFGGTVIFEMARILEQAGETAPLLIMIDTPEPGVDFRKDDVEFLMDRVPYYNGVTVDKLALQNSREAQVEYLLKAIKIAGLFRPDIDQSYAQNWFDLYKHHNMLVGPYKPTEPVNTKIIFFKPSEKIPFDVQMGKPIPAWKQLVHGGIEVHDGPGNHFNMISPVNIPVLVKKMKECIESQFSE
ncbi:amino acid adenylation domain-containing protein [Desulfobacterales bacterium HSG17]|nr:amino acid adenylation domain-containing protein [Desulfobacterales bacterium HSG17]